MMQDERISWETGELTTTELRGILIDALGDLWHDTYRQGRMPYQRIKELTPWVEDALYCATGYRLRIVKGGE